MEFCENETPYERKTYDIENVSMTRLNLMKVRQVRTYLLSTLDWAKSKQNVFSSAHKITDVRIAGMVNNVMKRAHGEAQSIFIPN